MITVTTTTKLSVKELAPVLGVSVWFVYKMRTAKFPMDWDDESRCLVTTEVKARRWIRRNKFRVVDGRPVTKVQK